MDAEGKTFKFLTDNAYYEIPFFQRAYVWNEDNWEDLIENLMSEKPSFLGSIIVKHVGEVKMGKPVKFSVVDGQQRLTTISILLKAISVVFPKDRQQPLGMNIDGYLWLVTSIDGTKITKISHSKYDKTFYEAVMKDEVDIDKVNDDSHPILRCYKYFLSVLNNLLEQSLQKVYDIFLKLTTEQCIVGITLSQDDNEQTIFDTINNAGVKLTSADTIKNSIFQRALELCRDENERKRVIKKYESSWETKFSESEEQVAFWDAEKRSGRVMRTNLEIFLHSFAIIKNIFNPQNNKIEDLAQCYKDYISDKNIEEMYQLIDEIDAYANSYNITWCDYNPSKIDFSNIQNRLLLIFDKYDVSTYTPYMLYCVKNFDYAESNRRLAILEKYLIRNIICGRSTKNYNKECYSVIHGEFDLEVALKLDALSDSALRAGIHHMNNKQATLILFLIELHRRNNPKCDEKSLSWGYSLEHVMPQDFGSNWSVGTLPVYGIDNTQILDAKVAEEYRLECIYSLGNMTLLTKQLNASIKNSSFNKKINGNGRYPGVKDLSTLFITRNDIIDPFLAGDTIWDERKIRNREENLYQEILEIWPL